MSQEIVLAALNSDPITAYVDAVIVPSNPDRKTLEKIAKDRRQDCHSRILNFIFLTNLNPKEPRRRFPARLCYFHGSLIRA